MHAQNRMNTAEALNNYVTLDKACIRIFPLLVEQLEIANQQLDEGVNALLQGFSYLASAMSSIDPADLDGDLSSDIVKRINNIQRFTQNLIKTGESIHQITVNESVEHQGPEKSANSQYSEVRTLNIQRLAADVKHEADTIIKELEAAQNALLDDASPLEKKRLAMVKTLIEMQMEVNKMIVAFQFQDRVSQIVNAVINSMQDLTEYVSDTDNNIQVDGADRLVNLAAMIERVECHYISKEQYELTGDHKDDGSDDIVLF